MALDSRTQKMLISWESKYDLNFIQQKLDEGLFVHDADKQRSCYLWLKARRAAPWIRRLWGVLIGLGVIAGGIGALISAFK